MNDLRVYITTENKLRERVAKLEEQNDTLRKKSISDTNKIFYLKKCSDELFEARRTEALRLINSDEKLTRKEIARRCFLNLTKVNALF